MDEPIFEKFSKIPRLSRDIIITEKIDGINGQIWISDDLSEIRAGSRNRWITLKDDHYGFAAWVEVNKTELMTLGPGRHFGEWWGSGIQRGYGLSKGEKRFSLFNTKRWGELCPNCCCVVPVLYTGDWFVGGEFAPHVTLEELRKHGSYVTPFMNPEGIVIYHRASGYLFKKTVEHDEAPKGFNEEAVPRLGSGL